ncbi:F-box/LRR-repeat protein 14-like [Mya arenaria]|uniref:F-box/LRR-repeat protein 14-like n=1 Tax=Mya arenaria TaxID=6604 RepID=UPI0022DFB545|nr:F-box/LRR-repeat protein 14-like [Mya arenaria]XP_052779021.1 F-box/LRR-repeat protein 14-like [Mya arenaria]
MADVFEKRNFHISSLFPEILTIIFTHLDVRDKGRACQVCVAWRDAAYNRRVWKGVEAKLHLKRANPSLFPSLVKRGIRRIQVLSLRRTLKDVIVGIQNIESLNISGCFSINDTSISHALTREIPSLKNLNLSLCKQITDRSLEKIAQCLKNLEVLELSGCSNITNIGLLLISWGLKKLKVLNLRSCRHVSDPGIGHLCGVVHNSSQLNALESRPVPGNFELEFLGLQDCQKITDQGMKHVSGGLVNLKQVNLSFCGGITDSGIKFLSKMPSLKDLNLRSCDNVTNAALGYLSEGGSRLEAIDVSFCENVGDQGLHFLAQGMFSLRHLSLGTCNITDEGLLRVVNTLHEIITLDIGQCGQITDKSLCAIGEKWKHLKSIDLYGCTRITTFGLEKIMKLPCLNTLNLGLWHRKEEI